jgi:predicted RND superfamily exporter protein
MQDVGASILFTTLTDCVAFFSGVAMDLPAIQYFSITAAIAVMAVFLFQVWRHLAWRSWSRAPA